MSAFLDFITARVQSNLQDMKRAKSVNIDAREPKVIVMTYLENYRSIRITFEDLSIDETVTLGHT